jgi:hypothetical protein
MSTVEQLLQEYDNADGNGDGSISFNTFSRLYNNIGGQENKKTSHQRTLSLFLMVLILIRMEVFQEMNGNN